MDFQDFVNTVESSFSKDYPEEFGNYQKSGGASNGIAKDYLMSAFKEIEYNKKRFNLSLPEAVSHSAKNAAWNLYMTF